MCVCAGMLTGMERKGEDGDSFKVKEEGLEPAYQ